MRNQVENQTAEWSSAVKDKRAASKRKALRRLSAVAVLLSATVAVLAALLWSDPPVEAEIEAEVPPGPVALYGDVVSRPIYAKLGTFGLNWIPQSGQPTLRSRQESIWIEVRLSRSDCANLSQIAGRCGGGTGPPLRDLESLRLEAFDGSLFVGVTTSTATGFELEQHGDRTHRGAPLEWALQKNAATTRVRFSCHRPVAFGFVAAPNRRGTPLLARSATCRPTGIRYRLRVVNDGPVVTAIGFNRLKEFEAEATAERGRIGVDRGKLVIDGDSRQIPVEKPTTVALRPERDARVLLQVSSPVADGPAEVRMSSMRVARVLVAGDDETPNEFERIPIWLITSLLIPWMLFLAGTAWRSISMLRQAKKETGGMTQ